MKDVQLISYKLSRGPVVCLTLLSAAQPTQMTSYREINDTPLVLLLANSIKCRLYATVQCVCVRVK